MIRGDLRYAGGTAVGPEPQSETLAELFGEMKIEACRVGRGWWSSQLNEKLDAVYESGLQRKDIRLIELAAIAIRWAQEIRGDREQQGRSGEQGAGVQDDDPCGCYCPHHDCHGQAYESGRCTRCEQGCPP